MAKVEIIEDKPKKLEIVAGDIVTFTKLSTGSKVDSFIVGYHPGNGNLSLLLTSLNNGKLWGMSGLTAEEIAEDLEKYDGFITKSTDAIIQVKRS